ncbi:MAG: hypothetical protein IT200_16925 [Thermoleophilia bacterium]|nr:hypothetical protein [Thermoleophilia bacterium]
MPGCTIAAQESARGSTVIEHTDAYRLGSLQDLMELLVDGWQIEHLHYADRCGLAGGPDDPAAFFGLTRAEQHEHLYLVDDGRSMSHRTLIGMFRDHPHVWKHRSGSALRDFTVPESPPRPPDVWGQVPEPFPEALTVCPTTLRGVVCVNQTQSMDGVTLAVTTLERFAEGARAHYLCHAPDRRFREDTAAMDAIAVDDGGRMYRVAPVARVRRGARIEGTLAIAPAVPAGVGLLTLTIGTLGPGAEGPGAPGPWVFPIPLDPPA